MANTLQQTQLGSIFSPQQGGSLSGGQNPAQPGGIQPQASIATPQTAQFNPSLFQQSLGQQPQQPQGQQQQQAAPQQAQQQGGSQTPVTVQLSNGMKLQFNGTPTQQDIDEATAQMTNNQQPSTQNAGQNSAQTPATTQQVGTNSADQTMYNQKLAQYTQQNQNAASSGWLGQLLNGLGRGVQQDVVGLRTLGAKALNAIGVEHNLDPNSTAYNPLLDTNSATRQLFNNLVAKGQTGWEKAGKTVGDFATIFAPGLGEEALAARGAEGAGTALGLFGGTDSAGVKLGTSLAQKAGLIGEGEQLGKGGTLAAKVLGNVIGGTAQTAVKNGGVTTGQIAGNALLSGLIHGTVGTTAESKLVDAIKQIKDPAGYATEAVDNNAPIVSKALNGARDAIKGSLSSAGYLKSEFGLGANAVERQNNALDMVAQHYMPSMTTNGRVLDANAAFDKVNQDLEDVGHIKNQLTQEIPGRVINRDTVLTNMESELKKTPQGMSVLKSGDYTGARAKLEAMLDDKFANSRVGGVKSGNMSIKNFSDFLSESANKEFGLNSENPSDTALRPVLYAFRKAGNQTIADAAKAAGRPEIADGLNLANQRISTMLDSKNVISKMVKDPNKFGQLSKHLFSLGVQGMSHIPGAYPAADVASDIVSNLYAKAKFKNITSSPILQELARRDTSGFANKMADVISPK